MKTHTYKLQSLKKRAHIFKNSDRPANTSAYAMLIAATLIKKLLITIKQNQWPLVSRRKTRVVFILIDKKNYIC